MTNYNDDSKLDKALLILRRVFVILFIFLLAWILLFKVLKINKWFENKVDSESQIAIEQVEDTVNDKANIEKEDKADNGDKEKKSFWNFFKRNKVEKSEEDIDDKANIEEEEKIAENEGGIAENEGGIAENEGGIAENEGGIAENEVVDLGDNYSLDGKRVFYKGNEILLAEASSFKVISRKEIEKKVINSDNLLEIFADYDTRVALMNNIDGIIDHKENVTNELKDSSENGMWKMKVDYNKLSQYNWDDRYDMTPEQRAKFAMMFLYIKIIKKQSNDQATMERALEELRVFLENFDKKKLEKEISDSKARKTRGDLAMDQDCLYLDGKLYACFLDGLF